MDTSNNSESNPPTETELADFLLGQLEADRQRAVEEYLNSGPEGSHRLEQISEQIGAKDTLSARLLNLDTASVVQETEERIPSVLAKHLRYQVLGKLGSGGMGNVYQALQPTMNREVAIKVLRPQWLDNDRALARFQQEIVVAAKLNHPNIVHSYDAEPVGGNFLLVMEMVEGEKLSDYIHQRNELGFEAICRIGIQIATALKYAHEQGMIHRDVKPENVLVLKNEQIKVTDFGLAKLLHESTGDGVTLDGELFGTPDYISPEQIRDSQSTDQRGDIYSLGCTLYFMLVGAAPFAELSVGEKLAGHLEHTPPSLRSLRPEIPPAFIRLVESMMAKAPDDRPQEYDAIIEALKKIEKDPSDGEAGNARNKFSRVTFLAGLVVLLAAAVWFVGKGLLPLNVPPDGSPLRVAIVMPSRSAFHPEVHQLVKRLRSEPNVLVQFVSEQTGRVRFVHRSSSGAEPLVVEITETLATLQASEIDAIVFTGAWNGKDAFETAYAFDSAHQAIAKSFLREMLEQEKTVAAVCAGTSVLGRAGALQGKRVANCRYLTNDEKSSYGANWSAELERDRDAIVVQDGNIITGGNVINCEEIAERVVASIRLNR
ncbi:MAG: protein kinase [Planctomycetota bacterium]